MEFYDQAQTQQLAPFVALSIGDNEVTSVLKKNFEAFNIANHIWNNSLLKNRLLESRFIFHYFDSERSIYKSICSYKEKTLDSHSIISPFNPKSELFPNGILSSKWFLKYLSGLPFAVISVYQLNSNRNYDGELGATLASLRSKYLKFNVHFVALIVSSEKNLDEEANRIAVLRQISELLKNNGIFCLNTNQDIESTTEILTTSILSSLKSAATEFYMAAETRVRQRFGKYYTLPSNQVNTLVELKPQILEIRNLIKRSMLLQFMHPNNVDYSLPILEKAYEGLIDLLRSTQTVFFSPTISTHDLKLYNQYRNLLDVIAIHLIRGYFSIEEPVAALRKHRAHIENVLDLLQSRTKLEQLIWESIQYQWLAEFLTLVPKAALAGLKAINKPKSKNTAKNVLYFGGIAFHDNFYSQVVTEPGLAYLKAASKINLDASSNIDGINQHFFSSTEAVRRHRISILKMAKLVQPYDDKDVESHVDGRIGLIDWQIAEELIIIGETENAIQYYAEILKEKNLKTWNTLKQLVLEKMLDIFYEQKDELRILKLIPELLVLDHKSNLSLIKSCFSFTQSTYSIELTSEVSLLNVQLTVFNKSLKKETFAFDTVIGQVCLQSAINDSILESILPGSKVTIYVDKIKGLFSDKLNFSILGTSDSTFGLEILNLDNEPQDTYGGLLPTKMKVIQLEKTVTRPGWFGIPSLKIQSRLQIEREDVSITFTQMETHNFNLDELQRSLTMFQTLSDGSLYPRSIIPEPQSACMLYVRSFKPEIRLKPEFGFSSLIAGEKIETSVEICLDSIPPSHIDFSSVTLEIESYVSQELDKRENVLVQTNWYSMKDDQPLSILDFLGSGNMSCSKKLNICVRYPPHTEDISLANLMVTLNVKMVVIEALGDESVYEIDAFHFPLIMQPFKTRLMVSPICKVEDNTQMPNPFILGLASKEMQKDYSMPLPLRTWVVKVHIGDHLKLLENEIVEIVLTEFSIKSDNAEVCLVTLGDATLTDNVAKQVFMNNSKHRFTNRSMAMAIGVRFGWKRTGSDTINYYEPREWESVLPLQDPRVLLQVQLQEHNQVKLKYTIENPTPRILTFTSDMTTQNAENAGTKWVFDDIVSLTPPKQMPFPVLPFSQFSLEYLGTFQLSIENTPVTLPQLQIYDVNYKVSLPTLAADENVISVNSTLILRT